jgi:hypothetical protein
VLSAFVVAFRQNSLLLAFSLHIGLVCGFYVTVNSLTQVSKLKSIISSSSSAAAAASSHRRRQRRRRKVFVSTPLVLFLNVLTDLIKIINYGLGVTSIVSLQLTGGKDRTGEFTKKKNIFESAFADQTFGRSARKVWPTYWSTLKDAFAAALV